MKRHPTKEKKTRTPAEALAQLAAARVPHEKHSPHPSQKHEPVAPLRRNSAPDEVRQNGKAVVITDDDRTLEECLHQDADSIAQELAIEGNHRKAG